MNDDLINLHSARLNEIEWRKARLNRSALHFFNDHFDLAVVQLRVVRKGQQGSQLYASFVFVGDVFAIKLSERIELRGIDRFVIIFGKIACRQLCRYGVIGHKLCEDEPEDEGPSSQALVPLRFSLFQRVV